MYRSEDILQKIAHIIDPEIGISIVDLGLIYEARQDTDGSVTIRMSLTTPSCPLGPVIKQQVVDAIEQDPEVTAVRVEWSFDPPWSIEMASPNARATLGF